MIKQVTSPLFDRLINEAWAARVEILASGRWIPPLRVMSVIVSSSMREALNVFTADDNERLQALSMRSPYGWVFNAIIVDEGDPTVLDFGETLGEGEMAMFVPYVGTIHAN